MPFGAKKVVLILGQTHPETPQCINTESNMLVVQRGLWNKYGHSRRKKHPDQCEQKAVFTQMVP